MDGPLYNLFSASFFFFASSWAFRDSTTCCSARSLLRKCGLSFSTAIRKSFFLNNPDFYPCSDLKVRPLRADFPRGICPPPLDAFCALFSPSSISFFFFFVRDRARRLFKVCTFLFFLLCLLFSRKRGCVPFSSLCGFQKTILRMTVFFCRIANLSFLRPSPSLGLRWIFASARSAPPPDALSERLFFGPSPSDFHLPSLTFGSWYSFLRIGESPDPCAVGLELSALPPVSPSLEESVSSAVDLPGKFLVPQATYPHQSLPTGTLLLGQKNCLDTLSLLLSLFFLMVLNEFWVVIWGRMNFLSLSKNHPLDQNRPPVKPLPTLH